MTERRFGYRWTIIALLFIATTINYVDRQVLGILAPTLQRDLAWSETDYGDIVSWFSFVYALGFLGVGRVIDRVGIKRGLGAAVWCDRQRPVDVYGRLSAANSRCLGGLLFSGTTRNDGGPSGRIARDLIVCGEAIDLRPFSPPCVPSHIDTSFAWSV